MTFPYRIVRSSRVPAILGRLIIGRAFFAQTIGPVIFFHKHRIDVDVLRHELEHVRQFYMGWMAGAFAWAVLRPSPWWLLLTPLTFTVAYVLAGFYAMARGGTWYRSNPFEVAARRRAGEL